tara:strand:- start:5919 stop:7130 length:1212 start_codon:yes stop_codon:yes gene_type:complete
MDFNLSRINEVAKKLNIHKTKSKIFTVAGTNGKGSTVAILESILIESGYNVGSYTSPHLLEFNERIKINKTPASTEEICEAFEVIEKSREDITLTFFEFSTLAALIVFSRKKLDVIILEVGLGGRLDAVNIIDPDISIITSIGLDHTAILGNDLETIAYEKSGIMRKGRPVIIGYKNIHNSILKYSKDIKSHLNIIDKDFFYEENSKKKWIFSNRDGLKIECKNPSMKGDIQINNAATAIQAIHCCEDIILDKNRLDIGLEKAEIIGRFQILKTIPVAVLDIAHNEPSVEKLIVNLKKYYPNSNFHAVFSVLKDKDVDKILNLLKGFFASWHISNSKNERALNVNELKKNDFFITENLFAYDSIEKAYDRAIEFIDNKQDIIVVFGSSYTIAPILQREYKKNE